MRTRKLDTLLSEKKNILKVQDRSFGYLQVLLREIVLTKEGPGRRLDIDLSDEMWSVVDGQGKADFMDAFEQCEPKKHRRKLTRCLQEFEAKNELLSYRIDCSRCPLRWANGGVLTIVRLDGHDYFCLFFRDIFPIGWNLANGGSDTRDELLDPSKVLSREFGEELLIRDDDRQVFFRYRTDTEPSALRAQDEAVHAWFEKLKNRRLSKYKELPLPVKWIAGPDSVRVTYQDRERVTSGLFLNITPDDNAIEVDRFALVNLNGAVSLMDGEVNRGALFNRVVGLFDVDKFRRTLARQQSFVPDILFFDGERHEPDELGRLIRSYLQGLQQAGLRKKGHAKTPELLEPVLDLCPISRVVTTRYFDWCDKVPEKPVAQRVIDDGIDDAAKCQIFISYKSADQQVATWLYQHFKQQDYRVFCSAHTLEHLGESNYARSINRALEAADCMVVVATRAEYLHSGWVEFEWTSFLNEILSDRKPKGELFLFTEDVPIDQMPLALRHREMVSFDSKSPQDALENVRQRIARVLLRNV